MRNNSDMMTRGCAAMLRCFRDLLSDRRGNMLIVFAAGLVPALMLVSSAVDIGRTYAVKTRLQQACDAGVLAGRRFLDSTSSAMNPEATTQANAFFRNNFAAGWFSTTRVSFAAFRNGSDEVEGDASATVPMELMNIFGMEPITVTVNCASRFDVPDADVMFVLDTTGSMAEPAGGGSKIDGLKEAVMLFYDTVEAAADPTTNLRYGFVPYASTANVGLLLPTTAFSKEWTYWTRSWNGASYDWGQKAWSTENLVRDRKAGNPATNGNPMTFWKGCVEERGPANPSQTTFTIDKLPPDLDPDLLPDQANPASLWHPLWPEVEFRDTSNSFAGSTVCSKGAKRLAKMTRQEVYDYVHAPDFVPDGTTWHDVGMIWGLRLISPKGMFAADTAAWPNRDDPSRHLVFMTDGVINIDANAYGQYGWEKMDKRTAGGNGNHTARFLIECEAAKARNINVWTIAFGTSVDATVKANLKKCASPGKAFVATDNAALKTAFKSIAEQIASLRLVQ